MQRLQRIFDEVKAFVCRRLPQFSGYTLNIGCPESERIRVEDKDGGRVYMHTRHHDNVICTSVAACELPDVNLYGLFLHEFGHHIGGEEQWQADRAVLDNFSISLFYDENAVEYINEYDAQAIWAESNKKIVKEVVVAFVLSPSETTLAALDVVMPPKSEWWRAQRYSIMEAAAARKRGKPIPHHVTYMYPALDREL